MHVITHRRATAVGLLSIVAMLLAVVTPAQGLAPSKKTFTLDVDGPAFAGDADGQLTITLTNTAKQQLGSANVIVPAVFEVTGVVDAAGRPVDTDVSTSQVVELRDLDIPSGERRSFTVTVAVRTCVGDTSASFDAVAKQSNRFRGRGNDFRLDEQASDLTVDVAGTCSLAFVTSPDDAERDAAITSIGFDPDGAPITVAVLDGSDDPMTATSATPTVQLTARNADVSDGPIELGGTATAMAVDGVATFEPGPTLSVSASDFTLVATADFGSGGGSATAATSGAFAIVDDAVDCPANEPCEATAVVEREGPRGVQRVTATFGEGPTDVDLVVGLGAADAPTFSCDEGPGELLIGQFFTIGGDSEGERRRGQVTYRIPGASPPYEHWHTKPWDIKRWLRHVELCWAAPYSFERERAGSASDLGIKPGGEAVPLHVGTLPDCARYGEPARPCISDRVFDAGASAVTIVVEVDSRDPWMRG